MASCAVEAGMAVCTLSELVERRAELNSPSDMTAYQGRAEQPPGQDSLPGQS